MNKFNPNEPTKTSEQLESAVSFVGVNFGYISEKQIIYDLNFTIAPGEYVGIIGHNGSGKSTISKILMGLVKPWSGTISVGGTILSLETLKQVLNKMGLIFQNPDNQFIGLTTRDDIAFGLENRKVPAHVIHEIISEVVEVMQIEGLIDQNASELSGGQKQRVAIAAILAINPQVIIFDEATSMLDPTSKLEVKALMVHLSKVEHKTVISITHDMEELNNCDRVLVMKGGRLVANCHAEVLFADPQFLLSGKLTLPFVANLAYALKNHGIDVSLTNNWKQLETAIVSFIHKEGVKQ